MAKLSATGCSPAVGSTKYAVWPLPETETAPQHWCKPVANSEYSLHQLSPYIGKTKSSIARDLIETYSLPEQLIVDPFCGAGTIALEASLARRNVFASDISPYAELLTLAKLRPPADLDCALRQFESLQAESAEHRPPDLRSVPAWVRQFFDQSTLKEAIYLAAICQRSDAHFILACLLGILHHQRPGFLSYPSSHLVPYLRTKAFPRDRFPEMYQYRPLYPRMIAKLKRAYRRIWPPHSMTVQVRRASLESVVLPDTFDTVITSPPYMNALDYGRDNRLRLWFLDPAAAELVDHHTPSTLQDFAKLMEVLAEKLSPRLRPGGHCVLIIGDIIARSSSIHPARMAIQAFASHAPKLHLIRIVDDVIPDIRRARRDCMSVKNECIAVFRKVS